MALALGIAPAPAGAAITIGTVRSAIAQGPGTNTLDITNVGISGSDRYLLVGICYGPEDLHTTVSVVLDPGGANQTNLTHLDSATAIFDNDVLCELWGVLAPPLGTFTVRATITNNLVIFYNFIGGAWPLSGVDQTTPRGTVVTNALDLGNGNPTVTVGSAAGEIVFGTAFVEGADGGMQIQAPGVEDWEHFIDDGGGGAHSAGAASVTLDWTASPNNDDKFAAIAVAMKPARGIAYSVGINPADLKNGAPTVGITSGLATFTIAQPDNVGVGDEVIYNGGTRAFISARISSTVYQLQTATGTTPPNVPGGTSVTSIKRAFNSLKDAVDTADMAAFLNSADLVANDWQLHLACYNDGPDPSLDVLIEEPWNTGPINYIRIFTPTQPYEVGVSQRHNGTAGTGYRLAPSTAAGANYDFIEVSIDNGYVRIEGIEIDGSNVTSTNKITGIQLGDSNGSDDTRVSHSLIHDITTTSNDAIAINLASANPSDNTKIWNNFIYNIINNSGGANDAVGIQLNDSASTQYVFNNTIYNIQKNNDSGGVAYGIHDVAGSTIDARNNYVGKVEHTMGGTQACFNGTFLNVNNNVSSDGTAVGASSQAGQNLYPSYFRSIVSGFEDLHLQRDSNAMWGSSGEVLSGNPNIAVTDDIDATPRHATTPDIGADEQGTPVYRSVGITATNLNTTPETVTISGTTATFSGPMPDNIGVGDVLTYVSGGNQIAFIAGRTSSTVFTIWNKNGGVPAAAPALTAVGVFRAYTSLKNWESGTKNPNIVEPVVGDVNPSTDLVSAGTLVFVPCYGDGEDTTSVHIGGWITGPDNYIRIYTPVTPSEVGTSQRHDGKWNTASAYRISNSASVNYVINSEAHYIRFDGLQLDLKNNPANADYFGIRQTDNGTDNPVETHFSNNIVRMSYGTPAADESYGILAQDNYIGANASYVAKVWNNVVYDFRGAGTAVQIRAQDNGTVYAFNNTLIGDNSASSRGINGSAINLVYVKNNIAIDAVDPYNQVQTGAGSTNNVSDTGDAPPTGARNCEPTFVNKVGDDYHLDPSDTCAEDFGADLSSDTNLAFTYDIDLGGRTVAWDIGADDVLGTTAVDLISFSASGFDGGVELTWETGSELDNLGFHLYRASDEGLYIRITERPIPGLGSSPVGAKYSYRDSDVSNNVVYRYKLEDIDTTGAKTLHGPVSATPGPVVSGSEPPAGSTSARITYGDPSQNTLRVLQRGSRSVVLELVTAGFYAEPLEDGSVRLVVPGFDGESDAMPVKRSWVEAVSGRKVKLASVQAGRVDVFTLRPSGAEHVELVASAQGTVRAERRRAKRAFRQNGLSPSSAARVVSVGFQEETKKALVELAPLRWDESSGQLLLARRLVVRLSFREPEPSEVRGRRNPKRLGHEQRNVVARLGTSAKGLYSVRFEDVMQGRRGVRSSQLRLSRQGTAVAYHLSPNAKRFAPGSVLYFVSEGERANPYGREAVYELELGASGETMTIVSSAASGAAQPVYWHLSEWEEDRYYQAALIDAPDVWLWDLLFAPETKSYALEVSGLAPGASTLGVWLQGASDFPAEPDHHVRVSVNGNLVDELSWDGKQAKRADIPLPAGVLVEGDNVLSLESVGDTDAEYSMVMLDRYRLEYPRAAQAVGGRLEGRWSEAGTGEIAGLSAGAHVLDVSDVETRWLSDTVIGVDGVVRFRAEAGKRYLAVSPDAVYEPTVTRPRRSRLKRTRNRADYVLVAPELFLEAVRPLVELRQSEGLDVEAVSLEEVYSEFGFGETTPEAVKDFLSYAYHYWREPSPRYVLLVGDGSYDFEDRLGTGVANRMPPRMVRTSYLWTASDPSYAAVNGDDLLPDLAIGRLPAATVEQVEVMVEKILAYERGDAGVHRSSTVLVADNPDEAGDFEADADRLASSVLASRDPETIFLSRLGSEATREAILRSFDEGASLVSYMGHGGIHLWADENVFNRRDVELLAPQTQQPILLTMNCLNGYFHFPYFSSLAEELVLARDKGAIAAFSPSGLSRNAPAHIYHRAVLDELVNGGHTRLGDAILDAQKAYAETGSYPELLSIYHLFGDPALTLR